MTPDVDELTWVGDHRLDVPDPDGVMTDRARRALVQHMSTETRRVRRRLPWLARATALAAVAAGAVVVFAGGSGAGSRAHGGGSATSAAGITPPVGETSYALLKVAHRAAETPALPGNATLVRRTTQIINPGQAPTTHGGYDLVQDNGSYYYGSTLEALRSVVSDPSPSDAQDASSGQVIAAAAASANLSPAQAAEKLLAADPHPTPHVGETDTTGGHTYTWTQAAVDRDLGGVEWEAIGLALEGGAGKPEVRAGALQAAAGLPDTTVTSTTVDGQPATEVSFNQGPQEGVESMTVNSDTGVLLAAQSGAGTAGGAVSHTTYEVSRVTAPGVTPAP